MGLGEEKPKYGNQCFRLALVSMRTHLAIYLHANRDPDLGFVVTLEVIFFTFILLFINFNLIFLIILYKRKIYIKQVKRI